MRHLLLFIGLSASLLTLVAPAAAGPETRPTTAPAAPAATRPAAKPAANSEPKPDTKAVEQIRQKVSQLTRKSIQLLEQKKLDDAEPVIVQALDLDPRSIVNLYNLACLKALKGQSDAALNYLEKAAEAGYTDFVHLSVDPDLDTLRGLSRYQALMDKRPAYQRRAADRALAELKEQFGDSYLYEIDEPNKLVFATNVDRQTLDALKKNLQAQAKSQWAQLFEHKPDEFIRIVVPSPADYKKMIKMPGVGGIYIDGMKMLIAQRLGQVMTHEFTHALHAADRAPLEQDHPIWLVEGLASLFEAAEWEGPDKGQLVPHDNFRVQLLQNAAVGNKLIPLDKLLAMDQKEFVAKANMAYGESSSLMLYLYEQKQLRPFYDVYKKEFDADPSGRLALEKTTGKKLPELQKAWVAWLKGRTAPALMSGADGPVLGAQLDGLRAQANDGVRVESVLPNGPADKAGLKVGDVLVGIGEHDVHDFQSFGPTINQFKPGDTVSLRVRREGKYVDLSIVLAKRSELLSAVKPKAEKGDKPAAAKPEKAEGKSDKPDSQKPATRPADRP